MTAPPLCCAFAPPRKSGESESVYPFPPCPAAAAPAASGAGAAAVCASCLVFAPLPLRSGLRSLRGAAAARCWSVSGLLRRRCPVLRRALAGAGGFLLGFAPLAGGFRWARAMRPLLLSVAACRCALLSSGRESAPSAWSACGLRLAPLCRLGARRPAPLFPPAVLHAAACSRYRGHIQPRCNQHQKQSKAYQKASKSVLFVRHIAASVPVCVNGQYADNPHNMGIIGQPLTLHKAQNAIQSPPHGGGLHPLGRGAKPQCPAFKAASYFLLCARHKCRSQEQIRTAAQMIHAPRPQRRTSALPPLEWLSHRLTRRAPRVYMSRRRDYEAPQRRGGA